MLTMALKNKRRAQFMRTDSGAWRLFDVTNKIPTAEPSGTKPPVSPQVRSVSFDKEEENVEIARAAREGGGAGRAAYATGGATVSTVASDELLEGIRRMEDRLMRKIEAHALPIAAAMHGLGNVRIMYVCVCVPVSVFVIVCIMYVCVCVRVSVFVSVFACTCSPPPPCSPSHQTHNRQEAVSSRTDQTQPAETRLQDQQRDLGKLSRLCEQRLRDNTHRHERGADLSTEDQRVNVDAVLNNTTRGDVIGSCDVANMTPLPLRHPATPTLHKVQRMHLKGRTFDASASASSPALISERGGQALSMSERGQALSGIPDMNNGTHQIEMFRSQTPRSATPTELLKGQNLQLFELLKGQSLHSRAEGVVDQTIIDILRARAPMLHRYQYIG
jgi:hypothetical protein